MDQKIPWVDWWTIAIIDLRISEDFFYELTPFQFFALLERHRLKVIQEDYRSGILASLIHNFMAKKPVNWLHWFSEHKSFLGKLKKKQDSKIDAKTIELNKMKLQASVFDGLARKYAREQKKKKAKDGKGD